jgi:hypothetical protein
MWSHTLRLRSSGGLMAVLEKDTTGSSLGYCTPLKMAWPSSCASPLGPPYLVVKRAVAPPGRFMGPRRTERDGQTRSWCDHGSLSARLVSGSGPERHWDDWLADTEDCDV